MDEFASIRHWTGNRQAAVWQAERGVVLGIGDDAAVMAPAAAADGIAGPKQLVQTVDTMVETVHFSEATMRDEDVGYKALAANVSDIAAMGGVPLYALVAVSVPPSYSPERLRRLYDGLYACAERYGVAIVGGDTTSAPQHLVVTVMVTGTVEAGRELRRSGAQPGDAVFVTGATGKAAAGLHALLSSDETRGALIQAHQRPNPSVRAGRLLLERGTCHSLNDVSDGLASEAWEIAEASGLRLVLQEQLLPKSGSMTAYASDAGVDPLEWMLYGGEDYVLLGTVADSDAEAMRQVFNEQGLPFYIIGKTEAGSPGVELLRSSGIDSRRSRTGEAAYSDKRVLVEKRGFNHFRR